MKFIQKKEGSCDIVFSNEEIEVLNKYKKLQLSKESTKHFINNLSNILFILNENLDEKTKNLMSYDSTVETRKLEDSE
jgi:Asp-tRNA(Asn)/Glu-tRNA(Gln) amidotransferase C subunit